MHIIVCLLVIPAVADGFMVWPSTVAERNVLSTSDLFGFRCPILFFSRPHVLTYIYIWGRVYFRLFYLDCRFDLLTVSLVVLSSSRAWSDPAVGVRLFQVASTVQY